jgi:hypothetical protein
MQPLVRFCREEGEPVSAKWERVPGLAQRLAVYTARRAVFNHYDRALRRRSERREAAEKKERLRQERLARAGAGSAAK